jgi:hypothetical protein
MPMLFATTKILRWTHLSQTVTMHLRALSVVAALPVAWLGMLSVTHLSSIGEAIWIPFGNMAIEGSAIPTILTFGHRHKLHFCWQEAKCEC